VTRYTAEYVLPCDGTGTVITGGVVDVTADGLLGYVGPAGAAPATAEPVVAMTGLLMPGLVNTHCHSPMTLFRGQGEGLPLLRWLREVIWPREARIEEQDVFWGMTLASAEMLRHGITTSCEMYFRYDAIAAAVEATGARALLTPGVIPAPWPWLGTLDEQLVQIADFYDTRHQPTGRIRVGFAAHSAYTVTEPYLQQIAKAAVQRGATVHIHVAESEHEGEQVSARHGGASVPRILAELGVLEAHVLAAHGVWLDDQDIAIFAEHGTAVAHCPGSNAKLASGIARVPELLAAGVTVGLGTDGPASNNDLDLWEEMRLASLLARLSTGDATALHPEQVIDMATRDGATALGMPDIGSLETGRAADFIRLDLTGPEFVPVLDDKDLLTHLVFAAPREAVRDVWVAGRQVVADGTCTTVDLELTRAKVQNAAARLADAT
jgi:5-methylthioadenosine/S-adenosylhomocysteine deaminase